MLIKNIVPLLFKQLMVLQVFTSQKMKSVDLFNNDYPCLPWFIEISYLN